MTEGSDPWRAQHALVALLHGIEDLLPTDTLDRPMSAQAQAIIEQSSLFHQADSDATCWIARAHRFALGAPGNHLSDALDVVTTLVRLFPDRPEAPRAYVNPALLAGTRSLQGFYPLQSPPPPQDLQQRRQELGTALLAAVSLESPQAAIGGALAALRRHGSCLAAHRPDCALYDHVRLTAAAAACLPDDGDNESLMLLVGDLSGIQKYIFSTAQGAGGPARRLRARSASLSLLAEVIGHRILDALALPLTNLLVATAGQLYLLLPSDAETQQGLEQVQTELARWLRNTYNGELVLHVAQRPMTAEQAQPSTADAAGCGAVMGAVMEQLGRSKLRPLAAVLQPTGRWDESAFLVNVDQARDAYDMCTACRRRPATRQVGIDQDDAVCDLCFTDYHFGSLLTSAQALTFVRDAPLYESAPPGAVRLLPPYTVQVLRTGSRPDSRSYLIAPLHGTTAVGALSEAAVIPRSMLTQVPRDVDGAARDFATLAADAGRDDCGTVRGAPFLGYLRVDIDRLGAIFAVGLRRDESGYDSLAHILTLSHTLDHFMSAWLQECLTTDYPSVYPVFGGGDDLALIGPWNDILELAEKIHEGFTAYVANPQMTLSAGVAIVAPGLPVARAADLAGAAEDLAKNGDAATHKAGRDSVAIFDTALSWSDLTVIRAAVTCLTACDAGIGSTFLHRLLYYGQLQRRYQRGEGNALRYKMRLAYDIGRNIREAHGVSDAVRSWCIEAVNAVVTDKTVRADLRHLEVVARWAILTTRKGEN